MAGALIGALRVTLGLDSAAFEKGADKARSTASRTNKSVSSDFARLARNVEGQAKILRASLAALSGSLVIGGIKAGISTGLEYASSLGEVAQQLGVSTRALQEYRYVATQVGIDQDQLDAGLQKLTRSIGQAANGAKVQAAAFDTLGISIRDQNGQLKSTDQILPELIAAFSRIADPARRAAIETQLFGKAGQQLDTLLAGGVSQVNNLRDAANKLGVVLSDQQIQNADDTADKLSQVQTVLKARIAGVVADNATAIVGLADSFATLTSNILGTLVAFRDWRNLNGLKAGDITAGRELLKSKSGRATLMNYYDDRLSENSKARAAGGLSAGEKTRLDAEFRKVNNLRNLAVAFDQRRSKVEAQAGGVPRGGGGGGGGGTGGGGGGGRIRAARAPRATPARSGPDLKDQAKSIIDGLFPEEAEQRRLEEMAATLGKAMAQKIISVPEYEKASAALKVQIASAISPAASVIDAIFPERATIREIEAKMSQLDKDLAARLITDEEWNKANGRLATQLTEVEAQLAGVGVAANDNARLVKRSNDEIIQSYADLAQGVLGSIRGLSDSIRGGDFLDILGSALDVVSQLAGAFGGAGGLLKGGGKPRGADGVSGLNLGGLLPGRANGGPVMAGSAYLVGERGPEILRMGAQNGTIIPNNKIGGRGISFDLRGAVVTTELYRDMQRIANDTSGRVVRANAPSIAAAGANGAQASEMRRRDRALA